MITEQVFVAIDSLPNNPVQVLYLFDESDCHNVSYIGLEGDRVAVCKMPTEKFRKEYQAVLWGRQLFDPKVTAKAMLLSKGVKFSNAALDHLERIIRMDTRGKSSKEIREEILKLAEALPKGHPLKVVPASYSDRGAAIQAYTEVRTATLKLTQPKEESANMATKPAGKKATEATTKSAGKKATEATTKSAGKKATGESNPVAEALAAQAKKKGGAKPKADLGGKYIPAGEAAKVKSTEELGMHEESVRTKILSAVLSSKSKSGVDYAELEKVGGDKTRGAIQYLIKRGFLASA